MKHIYLLLICISTSLAGQEIITGTYDFQTDPEKKYALYIPSTYDSTIPTKVIVGLHPWNTSKWDAESWAEELAEIAEANDCIVICPDGGPDGQIDDDIDTAFTSFLIDEMKLQYNLDANNMYLVGFSWGGKTVYTYGLSNAHKFAGFMPIGAAVEQAEVTGLAENAVDQHFYIIHGSQDSPNVRFTPLVSLMENNEACVETNLLQGIGHTVEFPDQFNILNTGLQWLINATPCNTTNSTTAFSTPSIKLNKTGFNQTESIIIESESQLSWKIFTSNGQLVKEGNASEVSNTFNKGLYFIQINNQAAIRFVIN